MGSKFFDYSKYYYIAKYKLQIGEVRYALFEKDVPEEHCMDLIEEKPVELLQITYIEDTFKDLEPDNYEDGCSIADSFVLDAINSGIKEGAVVSFDGYEGSRNFYKVYPKDEIPYTEEKLKVVNLKEWHKTHIEYLDSFAPPYC